jgi:hypothetical protein
MAALRAAASSARGGLPAAWRDAMQLLSDRRVLIETTAPTPDGNPIVLRTQLRLNGDVQTDILREWLDGALTEATNKLLDAHFRSVNEAVKGWAAVGAGVRLGSLLTITLGVVPVSMSIIPHALQSEWQMLPRLLLANWWTVSGVAIAAVGLLLRRLLRVWVQWKFHRGLDQHA